MCAWSIIGTHSLTAWTLMCTDNGGARRLPDSRRPRSRSRSRDRDRLRGRDRDRDFNRDRLGGRAGAREHDRNREREIPRERGGDRGVHAPVPAWRANERFDDRRSGRSPAADGRHPTGGRYEPVNRNARDTYPRGSDQHPPRPSDGRGRPTFDGPIPAGMPPPIGSSPVPGRNGPRPDARYHGSPATPSNFARGPDPRRQGARGFESRRDSHGGDGRSAPSHIDRQRGRDGDRPGAAPRQGGGYEHGRFSGPPRRG